jgi:hypothetical protein
MLAHNLLALVYAKSDSQSHTCGRLKVGRKKLVGSAMNTFMQEALWYLEILPLTFGCESCWQPGPMEKEEVGLKGEHRGATKHSDENMKSVGIDLKVKM